MGVSAFLLALSAMSMCVSVVNRGVAAGGGAASLRFGSSIVGVLQTYVKLFVRRSVESVNPMEWLACGLCLSSFYIMTRNMVKFIKHDKVE